MQFRVRSIILAGAFAAAMIGAVIATAASGSGTPLVWRSPASARYVVPLPRTWKLRTVKTASSEIDRWSDPNDRAARLLVTISDCARCVATHGQPNPKALVPKGLRVTSVGNGHAAFMGSTAGDKYEEHGLVIITRDSRGTISGALVAQIWLSNVLAPGSGNREWSYILYNLAAKRTRGS